MGEVIKLSPTTVSQETVDTLTSLLADARSGKVIGLTFVALHPGRRFEADCVGQSKTSVVFTLGALQCLESYIVALANEEK
jgi:hypothetical protein